MLYNQHVFTIYRICHSYYIYSLCFVEWCSVMLSFGAVDVTNRITDMSEGFFFSLMGLTSDSMTLLQNLWFLTVSRLFKIQGKNGIAVRWCNTVYRVIFAHRSVIFAHRSVIFTHRSVIFALLPSKHAPSWSGPGRLRWKRANFIHWNSHNLKLARRQKGQK